MDVFAERIDDIFVSSNLMIVVFSKVFCPRLSMSSIIGCHQSAVFAFDSRNLRGLLDISFQAL